MSPNISMPYGIQFTGNDGLTGRMEDFYFEDNSWAIRYVMANTGHWLSHRLVLLSPHAFATGEQTSGAWKVRLTRAQIE